MHDLSIVIPAYNEAERIPTTLDSVASYLDGSSWTAEVIVVDDGSTDTTTDVVRAHAHRFERLVVVPCARNGGKGRAVRFGMLAANGFRRLFLDADNSTDIRELDRLLAAADQEAVTPAVIIGSIADHESDVVRPQSPLRSLLGRLGNRVIQLLVLPGIDDSQRGFKVFDGLAAERIFRRCTIDGWAFDVEALAVARGLDYRVLEVPITWEHREDSRVRPGSYVETLADVVRIRRNVRNDHYRFDDVMPDDAIELPRVVDL